MKADFNTFKTIAIRTKPIGNLSCYLSFDGQKPFYLNNFGYSNPFCISKT